jgi:hypothetical protein
MDDDKDDELTLRDKLAAAALPALIQRYQTYGAKDLEKALPSLAILAYKMADAMRKARLQTFT